MFIEEYRIGYFIKEIGSIAQGVQALSFNWIPRDANKASNVLARWPLVNSLYNYGPNCAPLVLLDVILEDSYFVTFLDCLSYFGCLV